MSTIILSIFLSLFATGVMSYVALATPIGPWIAPTVVFMVILFSRFCIKITSKKSSYIVSAASIGGILATAAAFSFPTAYFLDSVTFNGWMKDPFFFSAMLGSFSFLAGYFGLFIADLSEKTLIDGQNLSFPIGQLVYKMIAAQNQIKKAYELMAGFCVSLLFSFLQTGIFLFQPLIPKTIMLFNGIHIMFFSLPRLMINFDTAPMVWAIGFVTGHVVAFPLAIGAITATVLAHPLQQSFFPYLSYVEFTLAFCSGIILYITGISLIGLGKQIFTCAKQGIEFKMQEINLWKQYFSMQNIIRATTILVLAALFFSYFHIPYYVQAYLLICSIITTYQIAAIAGRIGLALLGRFATFVMVPAMLVFNMSYIQLVFIATFVEMSGGVAADVLFGRKLAQLSGISSLAMRRYQLVGLMISSMSIGIIFWFLIKHFGLGSSELFAYRAQSRQLLIQAQHFNYKVIVIGSVFGFFLQQINCNPMLVLGGLLMPLDITIGLVFGGILACFSQDKEEWYPLWSGVFAGNSIWMVLRAIFL